MKSILIFLFVLFCIQFSYAQIPGGAPVAGGGFKGGGRQMNVGHLYGRVVDEKGKGVEFAAVQISQNKFDTVTHTKKDVVVTGQLTTSNGDFSLENLPIFGNLTLTITFLGYNKYEQPVSFNLKDAAGDRTKLMNAIDKDLGNIALTVNSVELKGVTIDGSAPTYELKIDKKVYNVAKDQTAAGGTAEDVLKNVPSVSVDIDGNVTLRNASPQIFVDGMPSTLTIDQIPADDIESIEVITNPSAKYDASGGGGGILNIVLKKNKRVGYNGNIRTGVDSRGRVNAGGDINARQGKINLFASGNFNQRENIIVGNTQRNYLEGSPTLNISQHDSNVNKGYFGNGRLGMDWFIDNRNTLTISGNYNRGSFNPTDELTTHTDTVGGGGSSSSRYSPTSRNFQNMGATISFKHLYPKDGKEWSGNINYSGSNSSNGAYYYTQNYDSKGDPIGLPINQKQTGTGIVDYATAQTDFTDPINSKTKIEAGARGAVRYFNSSVQNSIDTTGTGDYKIVPSTINNYKYTDQVYAAYVTFTQQFKKFGYQVGLRGESSFYNGALENSTATISYIYPISLFPSAYLSYKLNDNNSFQLNYSRKINRPNFFQLLPYTDYTDSLNLTRGNPDLKPEFTSNIEASWQKIFNQKNNILISIYFKNTQGLITSYDAYEYDSVLKRNAIIATYENANSSYAYGAEFTTQNSFTKWFDVSFNINAYNSYISGTFTNGNNAASNLTNKQFSWFSKLNATFHLPKNFTLQLTGDYKSRTSLQAGGNNTGRGFGGGGGGGYFGNTSSTAQGYIDPIYGMDASLKFEFLKNKAASLNLSVSDFLKTRETDAVTSTTFFTQTTDRKRDQQLVRLTFSLKFGKFDVSLFKRKNTTPENQDAIPAGG